MEVKDEEGGGELFVPPYVRGVLVSVLTWSIVYMYISDKVNK